jgi:glycerophosphoryl diester phosphodiesterase
VRRTAHEPEVLPPENTLAAFDLARQQGADGVELDVRLDRGDVVVVLHDATLERVTRGRDRRAVERLTYAELSAVELGADARIPRLEDVLTWASRSDLRVNIEIKRDVSRLRELVRRVSALVRDTPDAAERVLLSSFHPGVVLACARLIPHVPSAWLVHARQRWLRSAPGFRYLGASGVHPELALASAKRVLRWRAAGALLNVWTVNDIDEARRLAALGVDGIVTDTPGKVLAALR